MCFQHAAPLQKLGCQGDLSAQCSFLFACSTLDGKQEVLIQERCFEKNQILFRNQVESACLYVVLSGILTAFYYLPSGEPVVVGNMGRGATVGELELPLTKGEPYNVMALTPVRLCRICIEYLTSLLSMNPSYQKYILAASEKAARCMARQIWVMNAQRVYDRVVRMLMVLCNTGLETDEEGYFIPITHEDLAFLIHTDRISITRALKKLETEGFVELDYKHIHIRQLLFAHFADQGYAEMFNLAG